MKLFTLPWRNHRRTEWDHSHRQQKYLSAQPERPPEGRRSSPVKSLSQKDTLLFSSLPIAPSTSVARSLSAEKENPHAAWSAARIWCRLLHERSQQSRLTRTLSLPQKLRKEKPSLSVKASSCGGGRCAPFQKLLCKNSEISGALKRPATARLQLP